MAMLLQLALSLLAAIGCFRSGQVGAMTHIVGGNLGWHLPVANLSFYQDWAKPRNFTAGDKLAFLYTSGLHNVVEVKKDDYDACTQKHVIDKHNNGPTILVLSRSGDNYFICGIGSHCEGGQKLSISVINGDHETSNVGGVFGFIGDKSTSADSIRSSGMLISSLILALMTVLLIVRWSW
ncbi:Umecyanin [Morella rubra]|uniref:Umecyanin n=1 Tax=Morella rubra TaxID=262757 RepID=A0A6A1UZ99_9ROSI|nr:Umecyanin [Morella rubra]